MIARPSAGALGATSENGCVGFDCSETFDLPTQRPARFFSMPRQDAALWQASEQEAFYQIRRLGRSEKKERSVIFSQSISDSRRYNFVFEEGLPLFE
jgi:hypothetical protein